MCALQDPMLISPQINGIELTASEFGSSDVLQDFLSMLIKNKFKIEKWRLRWWNIPNARVHSEVNPWKVTLHKWSSKMSGTGCNFSVHQNGKQRLWTAYSEALYQCKRSQCLSLWMVTPYLQQEWILEKIGNN